jgi:uncharacterized membrane protein
VTNPSRVSAARLAWLRSESARWQADGLVDAEARARILAGYDAVPIERRGMQAIVVIALLMCAVGVLLLIGYNWDRIPRDAKIGMLIGSVAVSFAGSAFAYARDRATLGEWLAFSGTLLYGCSIWLIAQVLNISAHYPDGFFWWLLGAGATAALVRSRIIAVEAAILMVCWMAPETMYFQRPLWMLLPVLLGMTALAYRLNSSLTIIAAALAIDLWCASAAMRWNTPAVVGFDLLLIAGALLYAIGRRHPRASRLGVVWQASGLTTMVVALAPLMTTGLYRFSETTVPLSGLVMLAMLTVAAYVLLAPFGVDRGDAAVLATAAVGLIWALLLSPGRPLFQPHAYGPVLAFSACALALSLAFVWSAVRYDRLDQLCFGVLFAVAFLFVRWLSVIENMAWSALLMLATGASLLFVARAWRSRRQLVQGRPS